MTAPVEDPRGGEATFILCCDPGADVYPEPCPVHGTDNRRYATEDLSAEGHGYLATPPAAGRGDTASSGEPRVRVRGEQVAVHLTGDGWFLVNDARWLAPTEVEDWGIPASPAARPAGDRAQPTEELRELRADMIAMLPGVYPWGDVVDRLLAGPLAALLDAQAKAEQRIELARIEGRAESMNAEVHEMEDDDDAQLLAVRAIQWEQEAADLRRALDGA